MHIERWGQQAADPKKHRLHGDVAHFVTERAPDPDAVIESGPVVLRPENVQRIDDALGRKSLMPSDLQFVKDQEALFAAYRELNATGEQGQADWNKQREIIGRIVAMVEEGLE